MSLPTHFIHKKTKKFSFYIKGSYPLIMAIPTWINSVLSNYKVVSFYREETLKVGEKSMTKKINWKKELLDSAKFNKKYKNLMKNSTKSLTDSWLIGALYTRSKKIKGFREQLSPNCSSSFLEWNQKVSAADKCQS